MEVRVVRGVPLTSVTRILDAYQIGDVDHGFVMTALHMRTFDQLLCALDDVGRSLPLYEEQE